MPHDIFEINKKKIIPLHDVPPALPICGEFPKLRGISSRLGIYWGLALCGENAGILTF